MKKHERMSNAYDLLDYESALRCYHCGGENLHHERVEVFFREEDADVGLVVQVSPDGVVVLPKGNQEGNPSIRRDGIAICMWCEFCRERSIYNVVQHKGYTLTSITEVPKNESN